MADFKNGYILTEKGKELQAAVEAGTMNLKLTKLECGSGEVQSIEEYASLDALVNKQCAMLVLDITNKGNLCTIKSSLSSDSIEAGFFATELGLYAIGVGNTEILYAVGYDENPSYIPGKYDGTATECEFNITITFSSDSTIEITYPTEVTKIVELVQNKALEVAENTKQVADNTLTATNAASNAEISAKNAEISAKNAEISALNAKSSETNAKSSEDNSADSAKQAKVSEENAKSSAETSTSNLKEVTSLAGQVQENKESCEISESNAKTSEDNAKASELAAKKSADIAKNTEDNIFREQVQADWNETNENDKAFIKNKPKEVANEDIDALFN